MKSADARPDPINLNDSLSGITNGKPPLSESDQKLASAAADVLIQEAPLTPESLKGRSIRQESSPLIISIEEGKITPKEGSWISSAVEEIALPQGEEINLTDNSGTVGTTEKKENAFSKTEKNAEEVVQEETPAQQEEIKETPKEEALKEEPVEENTKSEEEPTPVEEEKTVETSQSESEAFVPIEEFEASDNPEESAPTNSSAPAAIRQTPLPQNSSEVREILIRKLEDHFEEERAKEKETIRENRTKEAVQSSERKRELVKEEVQRFLERSLFKNQELREALMITEWTEGQIKELSKQTAEIFFEGHPTYHSYLLSKELTGNLPDFLK